MTLRKLMVASAAATAMSAPMLATAESDLSVAAAGSASAQANLDFVVVIPSFIFFQVGTAGATIDSMTFDLATAGVEPGIGGAGVDGESSYAPATNTIDITLRTNASNVRIAATGGSMTSATTTDSIPLTDINVTPGGTIPVPTFGGDTGLFGGGLPGTLNDTWAFNYANTAIVEGGIYGGAANGGRVTYTATDI